MTFWIINFKSAKNGSFTNKHLCRALHQTTNYSVDFETIQCKINRTDQQIKACLEMLYYLDTSMIMPQLYSDKKCILHILHSVCQVYSKLCKICRIHIPNNDIISCEHSFINDRIVNFVRNNCICSY